MGFPAKNIMTPFIGSFTITDNILVGDPYIGKVLPEYVALEESNKRRYEINAQPGIWYAYHIYGNYRHPIALVLIEEELSFEMDIGNIRTTDMTEIGSVISSFGRMITAVDRQIINNTMYTYINTNDNMIYRIKDVRKWLREEPQINDAQIRQILNSITKNGRKYVEGSEISSLCNIERLPIESDLWANDCYFRLKSNPLKATVIMGGIVSRTYTDENSIYVNDKHDTRIIYIDLDEKASKAPAFRVY